MEQELDDIMEDLITGHNWDYAREALLKWRARNESYNTLVADNVRMVANSTLPATWLNPQTHKLLYNAAAVSDVLQRLESKAILPTMNNGINGSFYRIPISALDFERKMLEAAGQLKARKGKEET